MADTSTECSLAAANKSLQTKLKKVRISCPCIPRFFCTTLQHVLAIDTRWHVLAIDTRWHVLAIDARWHVLAIDTRWHVLSIDTS